jgi:Ala-tRNA(Pro) deacylase
MAATPENLLARLDALGIAHRTHHHPPVFTVAENAALRGSLAGGHCKCLFLVDRKGGEWLVVVLEDRRLDLKRLSERLGAPRFSFGSADRMRAVLGVEPGSVTPFALVNETASAVRVVLDAAMLRLAPLHYHPLVNTATTAISPGDLVRFIEACGHSPRIVEIDDLDLAAPGSTDP